MDQRFWKRPELEISRPKTFLYAAIWISAGLVGVVAVLYARLISSLQWNFFYYFHLSPRLVSLICPFLFVAATWLVKRLAPDAKGSGIPQVLAAIDLAKDSNSSETVWNSSLISLKTAFIKILSSCIGILGGASIGREGPTVQIAASGFAAIGHRIRRVAPEIDFQTFLIAGGAAGVSAAFNTPLAGITFALEEIADGMFGPFRQIVMLVVIIAGVIAQGLNGNYLYFGQPNISKSSVPLILFEGLILGIVGGVFGGIFARLLTRPEISRLPKHWAARAFVAGLIVSAIGYFTQGNTAGSGYEFTRKTLEDMTIQDTSLFFPFYKLITTVLSYLSGMAGGIFSPCLAIGSGLGISIAKIAHFSNFKACALIGMVAFFSGAVGAPLTSVIIVMEMTDEHILVIPFMVSAYIAFSVGRRIMPIPLYHHLARLYHPRV